MFRKFIFWLHLLSGLFAGSVVFLMSITGVALTYEKQMLRWAEGYSVQPSGAGPLGPEELLTRARLELGKQPSGIAYSADPNAPARISFGRESVAVDPYTGEKLGTGEEGRGMRDFMRSMILWHRWLGQEGEGRDTAKAVTGACNLAFLFICVSGLYLWWPKQWTRKQLRQITWFRGGLSPKARDFNWHNVLGLWTAIPLIVVVATATFFSYRWPGEMLYALTGEEAPQARGGGSPNASAGGRAEKPETEPDYSGLDGLWSAARRESPGWRTISIRVPPDPAAPVSFSVDRGDRSNPELRSTLTLDRKTAQVLENETLDKVGTARRIRSWVRFLHTGEALGVVGQTVAGIASAAACVLVYTGWMLTWRRFRAWRARS